jgi:UDP-glucose 6-dehydrogenase
MWNPLLINTKSLYQVSIPSLKAAGGFIHGVGFDVATVPELLRNDRAYEDALTRWITVVAAPNPAVLERLYALFAPFGGKLRTSESYEVAELVKVARNAYNGQDQLFNEIFRVALDVGIDGNEVSEIVSHSAEASVNPAYGIRGGAPFAGQCLPKDPDGLIAFAASRNVDTPVLEATREINRLWRFTQGITPFPRRGSRVQASYLRARIIFRVVTRAVSVDGGTYVERFHWSDRTTRYRWT